MVGDTLNRVSVLYFLAFLLANVLSIIGVYGGWELLVARHATTPPGPHWTTPLSVTLMVAAAGVASVLVPSHFKNVLVFWRLENPHPGSRAFSQIAVDDPRMSHALPRTRQTMSPQAEYALFNDLLVKHQSDNDVAKARRRFVLFEMMAISSGLLLIGAPFALLALEGGAIEYWFCLGVIICEYLLISEGAANAGIRLVRAVLLKESETQRGLARPA